MFAEERKSGLPKQLLEKRFMGWELILKGGELDGAPGPTAGCAYPTLNVWPRWGKDGCRIFSGWFLPGNKLLSKVLSNATKEIGHLRKTIDYE